MKIFIVTMLSFAMVAVVSVATVAVGAPKGRTSSVVNIDGARYYIHTIEQGETLYSLAKVYGVSTGDIYELNPSVRNGYKLGMNIKIPYVVEPIKNFSDKKLLKTFDIHKVVSGETLYAISRKYSISVDMILDDNPMIDPASLAIDQNVLIRKSEQGQTSAKKSMSELDDYRLSLNKLQDQGLVYHLVDESDTLDSLREEFDMVEGEIEDLNNLPIGEPVAVGMLILVNDMGDELVVRRGDGSGQDVEGVVLTSFESLSYGDTLRVSLLLPLSIRGYAMKPIVEFYNGFMLGVEELTRKGRSVEVNLFNTERSAERVEAIVESETFLNSDLIVGPVYEELMPLVLASAELINVPVVSPLATLKSSDSELLFQVAPVADRRYDKLAELLEDVEALMVEELIDQELMDEYDYDPYSDALNDMAANNGEQSIVDGEQIAAEEIAADELGADEDMEVVQEEEETLLQILTQQIMRVDSLSGRHFYNAIETLADFGDDTRLARTRIVKSEEESPADDKSSTDDKSSAGKNSPADKKSSADKSLDGDDSTDRLEEQILYQTVANDERDSHRITLIFGDNNDEEYTMQIDSLLQGYNKRYEEFVYSYEHPSAITERERKLDDYVRGLKEYALEYECEVDSMALVLLKCKDSKSNLTQLIANGAEKNTFFIMSDNETEVDRILSALASAYTTQAATLQGTGKRASQIYNFSVVANPSWRGYDNIDKTIFFRDRVISFPSYSASRASEEVRAFDGTYCEVYDDFPSLYSYRGYDVAMMFGEGMFGDIRYGMEGRIYSPLQTRYRFETIEDQRRRVNTNWMRVRYNLDFTLNVE